MEVGYTLTLEDLVALNDYKVVTSSAGRGQARIIRVTGVVVLIIGMVPLLLGLLGGDPVGVVLGLAACAMGAFYVFFGGRYYLSRSRKLARQLYSAQPSGITFVPRRLRIDERGVRESSDWHETVIVWTAVTQVVSTPDHIFMWIGPMSAFIVPRSAFAVSDQFAAFAAEANARHSAALAASAA